MDELKRLRIMCSSHTHAHQREARLLHLSQVVLLCVMGGVCVPAGVWWLHPLLGVVGIATLCVQIFSTMGTRCMQFYANAVCLNRYLEAMVVGVPEIHARFGGYLPQPSPSDVMAASEVVSAGSEAVHSESSADASGATHTPITLQPA